MKSLCVLLCFFIMSPLFAQGVVPRPAVEEQEKSRLAIEAANQAGASGSESQTIELRRQLMLQKGIAAPPVIESPLSIDKDVRFRINWSKDQVQIYQGERARPGRFPEVVSVTAKNGDLCSGVLVGARAVLTAAHCVCAEINATVIGGNDMRNPQWTARVQSSETMNSCSGAGTDVAMLRIDRDAPGNPAVFAAPTLIDSATQAVVVGFGETDSPILEPIGPKRFVKIPIASPSCSGSVQVGGAKKSDTEFYGCAAKVELVAGAPGLNRDTCHGDSGGPLYVVSPEGRELLAGITSRATKATECGDGGIYVRTDGTVREWLVSKGIQ